MREPDLVFEFQTQKKDLWLVMGWSKGADWECGRGAMAIEAQAQRPGAIYRPFGRLCITEATNPQVTVNGIIDWLETLP